MVYLVVVSQAAFFMQESFGKVSSFFESYIFIYSALSARAQIKHALEIMINMSGPIKSLNVSYILLYPVIHTK